jgi:hypothetical protein
VAVAVQGPVIRAEVEPGVAEGIQVEAAEAAQLVEAVEAAVAART